MQEEVNEKTISLCIKGGKITAKILKAALIKLLAEMDKKKKQQEKGKGQCKRTGKQSMVFFKNWSISMYRSCYQPRQQQMN